MMKTHNRFMCQFPKEVKASIDDINMKDQQWREGMYMAHILMEI